jgi:hypothetical protein
VYNEQRLVSLHCSASPVTALCFGQYGREGTTLISVLKSGGLDIRMLPRTVQLEAGAAGRPLPEQDTPLQARGLLLDGQPWWLLLGPSRLTCRMLVAGS